MNKTILSWLRFPFPSMAAVAFLDQNSGHNITVPVVQTFVHKKFTYLNNDGVVYIMTYDIALLKLKNDINIEIDHDKFLVNTLCIPNQPLPVFGKVGQFSGWGLTGPEVTDETEALLHANYMVRNFDTCKVMFNDLRLYYER